MAVFKAKTNTTLFVGGQIVFVRAGEEVGYEQARGNPCFECDADLRRNCGTLPAKDEPDPVEEAITIEEAKPPETAQSEQAAQEDATEDAEEKGVVEDSEIAMLREQARLLKIKGFANMKKETLTAAIEAAKN